MPDTLLSHDELLDWSRAMIPKLAERAAEGERLRAIPPATLADCDAVNLWSLIVPRHLGGHGLGLRSLCQMAANLAHGDASTAWTVSFLTLHNWFVLRAPAEVQAAVFGGNVAIRIATPLAPAGVAVPVEGGYRIDGQWQWATGVLHADWVAVMAFVTSEDRPRAPRVFLMPVADVELVDTWHTSGMRATGSLDVAAHQLFVPDRHTMDVDHLRGEDPPGFELHGDRFLRYPMSPVLCLYSAATVVGAAEAAVDHFRDLMGRRILAHTVADRQADQATSQARLAEARATVRAARLVWQDAIDTLCDAYDSGREIPRAERGPFRLAVAHTVKLARQAVETCSVGIGAGQYFTHEPFQRIERDLNMLKGHVVYDWDRVTQLAGRLELGMPPGPTDML